ncbi:MAG: alpha-glucan family phosphorylase [Desulfobacca sp.]|uniref:alpha-glucan family phosphorylase n=1 Tax=Desulfobacca sp. TaxID=2067990 RepID=UPI0040494438
MILPASLAFGTVAYFSMEIGLQPEIPTYSGGLGVLAGDTLRSAADLGVPMVGVTLLHRRGYMRQHLDPQGNQSESPEVWNPEDVLEPLPPRVSIVIEDRQVQIRSWRYLVRGVNGHTVPVFFLDTALSENSPYDQTITDNLYGGDQYYRLCQEAVLGIGGVALLRALGYENHLIYHMNEGHSALLTVPLLESQAAAARGDFPTEDDFEAVRQQCVFTTHTPVPAGHDKFPWDMVRQVLGPTRTNLLEAARCCVQGSLNMTYLALRFSKYINGVAMRHGEISTGMFPGYPVNAITNGVHATTWTAPSLAALYDRHIPEWRQDNFYLRYAIGIPLSDIQVAHLEAKQALLAAVRERTGIVLAEKNLTIGFARRATAYKRQDLLFTDLERLRWLAQQVGPLQVIYGGKAHPQDDSGKEMIRRVFAAAQALADAVPVLYLENYDMGLGKLICAGVDLWLNTPLRPQEASGTSGMKAALNGVPSFSVLDGWWIEGHVEHVTGWSIGNSTDSPEDYNHDAASLYEKLEKIILPLYYGRPERYAQVRRAAIALNGSFFNTQRMLSQYVMNAYEVQARLTSRPPTA